MRGVPSHYFGHAEAVVGEGLILIGAGIPATPPLSLAGPEYATPVGTILAVRWFRRRRRRLLLEGVVPRGAGRAAFTALRLRSPEGP
jgi:hypothetical protein